MHWRLQNMKQILVFILFGNSHYLAIFVALILFGDEHETRVTRNFSTCEIYFVFPKIQPVSSLRLMHWEQLSRPCKEFSYGKISFLLHELNQWKIAATFKCSPNTRKRHAQENLSAATAEQLTINSADLQVFPEQLKNPRKNKGISTAKQLNQDNPRTYFCEIANYPAPRSVKKSARPTPSSHKCHLHFPTVSCCFAITDASSRKKPECF